MRHFRSGSLGIAIVTLIASAALVPAAGAQQLLYTFDGTSTGEAVGAAAVGVGDVNGDGLADFAIARAGRIDVLSGATGQVIQTKSLPFAPSSWADVALGGAGDLDGDGKDDYIVAQSIFSGATGGSMLYFHRVTDLAPAGDTDADGFPDLVEGCAHCGPPGLQHEGTVTIHSKSGAVLLAVNGLPFSHLGASVAGLGDVDLDGHSDVAGATDGNNGFVDHARLVSGRTGATLLTAFQNGCNRVLAAGDLTRDGVPDFLVTGKGNYTDVLSGTDGTNYYTGGHILPALDVTGDGTPDVLEGSMPFWPGVLDPTQYYANIVPLGSPQFGLPLSTTYRLSPAGDVDGNGVADIILFDRRAKPAGVTDAGRVRIVGGHACGSSVAYGAGCGGASPPKLVAATMCFAPDLLIELGITHAPAFGLAAFVVGGQSANVAFAPGCTLLAKPDLVAIVGVTSAIGEQWVAAMPPVGIAGTFYVQGFVAQPSAPGGAVATAGCAITILQ